VSLIVPIFRDSGFDAEATGALGKAYDIACRALHPKGQPPVVQEILAKKIIEVAQRGERDPDRLAAIALANLGPFHRELNQTNKINHLRKSGMSNRSIQSLGFLRQVSHHVWRV
jgi:hypothetical protein